MSALLLSMQLRKYSLFNSSLKLRQNVDFWVLHPSADDLLLLVVAENAFPRCFLDVWFAGGALPGLTVSWTASAQLCAEICCGVDDTNDASENHTQYQYINS